MKPFIPDMNDRELDDLFREAAAKSATPARREEVWAKLEEKLATPEEPHRRKWILLLIPLGIIAGLLSWYLYSGGSREQVQHASTGSSLVAKDSGLASPISRISGRGHEKVPPGKIVPDHTTPSGNSSVNQQVVSNVSNHKATVNDPFQTRALPEVFAPLRLLDKLPLDIPDQSATRMMAKAASSYDLPDFKSQTPASSLDVPGEPKEETISMAKHPKSSKRTLHWTIGITAGPDWSSVAAKGWGTGVGGGLKLGYRLNDKWALTTGVLLDKKIYEANPGDYNPSDNNWRNYDVRNINANCAVIDVPINVEYTLWSNQEHRILLSTGLSSFWMHREEYTYHYKTAGGSWAQWSKEMYGQNHYLLSVLNLSAGYEKSWKNVSFEVSPYVKVPLGGIGYGRVKLLSTGVHFTLQYGLK